MNISMIYIKQLVNHNIHFYYYAAKLHVAKLNKSSKIKGIFMHKANI